MNERKEIVSDCSIIVMHIYYETLNQGSVLTMLVRAYVLVMLRNIDNV